MLWLLLPRVRPMPRFPSCRGRREDGRRRRPLVDAANAVDANQPGGQAAAELAADRGHCRPGERAGLLEAEVLDLQPGRRAVLPPANDRLGDLVRIHAELGPGVLGPGAQLPVRSATNTSSPASRSGWPLSSS